MILQVNWLSSFNELKVTLLVTLVHHVASVAGTIILGTLLQTWNNFNPSKNK